MKRILNIVLLMLLINMLHGQNSVRGLFVEVPSQPNEFIICEPIEMDKGDIDKRWEYALRYYHGDGMNPQEQFDLILVRDPTEGIYTLIYNEKEELIKRGKSNWTAESRINNAKFRKEISREFAQALYDAWTNALLRASYGDYGRLESFRTFYYISSFGKQTGYMHAANTEYRKGSTTGNIVEIGLLLKKYMMEENDSKAKKIEEEIKKKCSKISREEKKGFWKRLFG